MGALAVGFHGELPCDGSETGDARCFLPPLLFDASIVYGKGKAKERPVAAAAKIVTRGPCRHGLTSCSFRRLPSLLNEGAGKSTGTLPRATATVSCSHGEQKMTVKQQSSPSLDGNGGSLPPTWEQPDTACLKSWLQALLNAGIQCIDPKTFPSLHKSESPDPNPSLSLKSGLGLAFKKGNSIARGLPDTVMHLPLAGYHVEDALRPQGWMAG